MTTQPQPPPTDIAEHRGKAAPGWVGAVAISALIALSVAAFVLAATQGAATQSADTQSAPLEAIGIIVGIAAATVAALLFTGLTVVAPGTTKVLTFFGRYIGTIREPGFYLVKLLSGHARVSVRVRNFETGELKVNDADGNPVNIAAIVVWKVAETAKASFAVEDYKEFVKVQAESALRHVATNHPYDGHEDTVTLRGSTAQVSGELANEVAERVAVAGVVIVEVRISKLAYAPEIAQAMLQRQQAGAIIAAREKIVEGAVTMVQEALNRLENEGIVTLDDERRAAMVSNLLVVLTGEARATPVINAGSLYA